MITESKSEVGIKLEEEMIFKCDLGRIQMSDLYIDEQHKKSVDKIGPNPAKLLALSVLGCLAASFAFCLQKKNFSLSDLDGKAIIISKRNEKGLWRLQRLEIKLNPKIENPEMQKRAAQCIKFFEQYCIISESLRNGIDIDVEVKY